MTKRELKDHIFVAVVEDNNDPKRLGRCKCRVINIFDDLPVEDLPWASPWKDLNGNQFILPEKGKVVSVVFDEGNIYKPEYIFAEHYNVNLEKKLSSLSGGDYISTRAVLYDHKTQIYSNDSEGLKVDYKFNNLNITESGIDLNLKDNVSKLNLGTSLASQQAILGNHFLNWFDKFLSTIVLNGHLGNLASPLVPTPEILDIIREYSSLRNDKFLSHHVNITDNNYVKKQDRGGDFANGQIGDTWKSTVKTNESVASETVDYQPSEAQSTDTPVGQQLSPSPDSDGTDPPSSKGTPPAVASTDNADINVIFDTMKRKNYVIYDQPWKMNIIGIRRQYEGMQYSNKFVDDLYLIYKNDNNKWEIFKYNITTMPGFYFGDEDGQKTAQGEYAFLPVNRKLPSGKVAKAVINIKQSLRFKGRNGLGMVKPSQMIDIYYRAEYPSGFPALKNAPGSQPVYRDTSASDVITYTVGKKEKAMGGCCYFHYGGKPGSVLVNDWSEGCQVFSNYNQCIDFMDRCDKSIKKGHPNKFTYTLMEERDLKKGT